MSETPKPRIANTPEEMEALVQQGAEFLEAVREPVVVPLEWFINSVIEEGGSDA